MRYVVGATAEEDRLVKGLQAAAKSVQDGSIGQQTLVDLACIVDAPVFPLNVTIYNSRVIVARDITPAAVNAPLASFANSISGSFSSGGKPCSILVANGRTICGYACHAFLGKPESVLYRLTDGTFGIKRARYSTELPADVKWAVGGAGLMDFYDPAAEGFTGRYADVLKINTHTFLGVKNKHVFLGYVVNMSGRQVNNLVKDKLRLELAILLDGGHVAAINGKEDKRNTAQTQYYVVQALQQEG